jgi:hypothetical protein
MSGASWGAYGARLGSGARRPQSLSAIFVAESPAVVADSGHADEPAQRPRRRVLPAGARGRGMRRRHELRGSSIPAMWVLRVVTTFSTASRRPGRAARAAATARTPSLPLALPLRRRPRGAGWREKHKTGPLDLQRISAVPVSVPAPAARIVRDRAEPVKAACDRRPTTSVELPGERTSLKEALTEPARSRSWQLSGAGTRVARDP